MNQIPNWCPPPAPTYARSTVTHRVRKGETLSTIARRYGTSVRSIMRANKLRSSRYIKVGWRLKVPVRKSYVSNQKAAASKVYAKKSNQKVVNLSTQHYTVRKGDSLWKIANRFSTTTKAIQTANRISGTALSVGQVLRIPGCAISIGKDKTVAYRVLKGDSPYIIAQKHQMELSTLLRLNQLTPRSTIFPGQILLVKAK